MIVGMRLFPAFVFLTLVGSFVSFSGSFVPANAAPNAAPARPGLPDETSPPQVGDPAVRESIQPAPAGEPPPGAHPAHRPVRVLPRELTFHAGFLGGNLLENDETEQSPLLGLMWSREYRGGRVWDFQLDVGFQAWVRAAVGRRFYFEESQYLPYWKVSLHQAAETERVPAGLVDLERVKINAALGFADLFEKDRSVNAEFSAGWGMKGIAFSAQVGFGF